MERIYKYEVPMSHNADIEMPEKFTVLSVHNQNNNITMWALVETTSPTKVQHFKVFGTGFDLPKGTNDMDFVGTVIIGQYVWHVFLD